MSLNIILIDDHTLFRSGVKALLARHDGNEDFTIVTQDEMLDILTTAVWQSVILKASA